MYILVHKQMSIYNLRRFVYNLRSFNECLFYLLLSYIFTFNDNTCTKVTSKMFSSNTKAVRHTCNCIVLNLEIYIHILAAHAHKRHDMDCTNYQTPYVVKYKHSNVAFNI